MNIFPSAAETCGNLSELALQVAQKHGTLIFKGKQSSNGS